MASRHRKGWSSTEDRNCWRGLYCGRCEGRTSFRASRMGRILYGCRLCPWHDEIPSRTAAEDAERLEGRQRELERVEARLGRRLDPEGVAVEFNHLCPEGRKDISYLLRRRVALETTSLLEPEVAEVVEENGRRREESEQARAAHARAMTGPKGSRRSCLRKVSYESSKGARRARLSLWLKRRVTLRVYPCPHCNQWHLTSQVGLRAEDVLEGERGCE